MFDFEKSGRFDDAQDMLIEHITTAEFAGALQIFIERKEEIPAHRRRFYFFCIQDGLENYKSYRRLLNTALIMLALNLLILPLFSLQLLDVFAFLLPRPFLYYNYFSALLPHIFNGFFVVGLMLQWHNWVALPGRLFGRRVPLAYRAGFFALIGLVSVYLAVSIVPFVKDWPMVSGGEYHTRIVSEEEMIASVYGEIIATTDRQDVADTLRRELQDTYGLQYPDDIPPPYRITKNRLLGTAQGFFMDAEGEYYSISSLQVKATAYDDNAYPIIIKYLHNSKIILQITNGAPNDGSVDEEYAGYPQTLLYEDISYE